MRIDLGHDEPPEIGLIALIDCIFFLLMFFMVATSFRQDEAAKPEKELPVLLPAAQASLEAPGGAGPLVLSIDRQGRVYVDGSRVSVQGLHDVLKREAARNAQRPVRIDGDEQTPYQHIVHVLDLCQFEGLTHISLHTRQ